MKLRHVFSMLCAFALLAPVSAHAIPAALFGAADARPLPDLAASLVTTTYVAPDSTAGTDGLLTIEGQADDYVSTMGGSSLTDGGNLPAFFRIQAQIDSMEQLVSGFFQIGLLADPAAVIPTGPAEVLQGTLSAIGVEAPTGGTVAIQFNATVADVGGPGGAGTLAALFGSDISINVNTGITTSSLSTAGGFSVDAAGFNSVVRVGTANFFKQGSVTTGPPVPEPSVLVLLMMTLGGALLARRSPVRAV